MGADCAELLRRGREGRLQQLAQPRTKLWQRCAEIKLLEEQEQLQVGVVLAQKLSAPNRQQMRRGEGNEQTWSALCIVSGSRAAPPSESMQAFEVHSAIPSALPCSLPGVHVCTENRPPAQPAPASARRASGGAAAAGAGWEAGGAGAGAAGAGTGGAAGLHLCAAAGDQTGAAAAGRAHPAAQTARRGGPASQHQAGAGAAAGGECKGRCARDRRHTGTGSAARAAASSGLQLDAALLRT